MAQSFPEFAPATAPALAYTPTALTQLNAQRLLVGQSLSFALIPKDQTGQPLQITAYNLPENARFDPATGRFWFTPTSAQAGNVYQISFRSVGVDGMNSLARLDVVVAIDGAPAVNLLSPNQSLRLTMDQPVLIAWSVPPSAQIAKTQIRLSTDGGASYPAVIADLPGSANQFQWLVPQSIPVSSRSFIRLMVKATDSGNRTGVDYSRQDLRITLGSPQR